MRLFDLFENEQLKTAVIGFGRFNPPTTGHGVLVDAINKKAKEYSGDPMLFLTMSHTPFLTDKTQKLRPADKIKNPLTWKQKLSYAQKFFNIPISTDPSLNTIMAVMKSLETKGYQKVVLVCGSDRVQEFESQILPFNNTPDKAGKINFNLQEVSVEEGGFRDEEADDASGMSASKMREAAANNDFETFKQGVPVDSLAQKMFDEVRQALGMNHQTEEKTDEVFGFATRRPKQHVVKRRPPEPEELTPSEKIKQRRKLASKIGTDKAFRKDSLKQYATAEATLVKPMGGAPIKRPNPVAKNANATVGGGGAGAHRDKKKDSKKGYEKHKGKQFEAQEPGEYREINGVRYYIVKNKSGKSKAFSGPTPAAKKYAQSGGNWYNEVAEGYQDLEVMGHKYMPDEDREDDNVKIWHTIITPQGKSIDADFTPYSYMDKEDIKLYIKLKYPKRITAGPLDKEDLQKLAQTHGLINLDSEMANAGKKEAYGDEEDWGSMSKREFKRRELDHELGHEKNNYAVSINGKQWKVFPNKQQAIKAASTIQMKYGKDTKVYATMENPS